MSKMSCINVIVKFLEKLSGRLTFGEIEKCLNKALDENPIFAEIERSGAFGKNIIIILGGRGCGKTFLIRYMKYKFEGEGWKFEYMNGTQLIELFKTQGEKALQQIIDEQNSELSKDPNCKIVLAIDDIAEALEISREFLRKEIEIVRKYEGKIKLVLASQSERIVGERIMTVELLEDVLIRAPSIEMFFGEEPSKNIMENFINSYINKRPAILFRGAALINLDAYWSGLRALDKVEKLAETIVKLTEFYVKNAGTQCDEALEIINRCKYGLALLALSSIPKIISIPGAKIVIEYRGSEPALNGLGIAELICKFFANAEVRSLASEAEVIYNELKELQVSIDIDAVKEILLKTCNVTKYMSSLKNVPISSLVPLEFAKPERSSRRKYGPRADLIEVRMKVSEEREERKYIILHTLKMDEKGYITSGSVKKLRELVQYKVPSEAELRYLAVLIPAKKHIKALYVALGYAEIKRKGRDVLPLFADTLSDRDKALVHLIKTGELRTGKRISQELQQVLHLIAIGTLIFSLRDDAGVPYLAYLMLPHLKL
jgi:hypothetical protein